MANVPVLVDLALPPGVPDPPKNYYEFHFYSGTKIVAPDLSEWSLFIRCLIFPRLRSLRVDENAQHIIRINYPGNVSTTQL